MSSSIFFSQTVLLFMPYFFLLLLHGEVVHMLLIDLRLLVESSSLVSLEALLICPPWIILKLRHQRQVSPRLAWLDQAHVVILRDHGTLGYPHIDSLELLLHGLLWHTSTICIWLVRVWSHLSLDLRTSLNVQRSTVQAVAPMLHTTDTIDHIICCSVDPASHAWVVLLHLVHSRRRLWWPNVILPRWFIIHGRRLLLLLIAWRLLLIGCWSDLSWLVRVTFVIYAWTLNRVTILSLAGKVTFFFHKSSLLHAYHSLLLSLINGRQGRFRLYRLIIVSWPLGSLLLKRQSNFYITKWIHITALRLYFLNGLIIWFSWFSIA